MTQSLLSIRHLDHVDLEHLIAKAQDYKTRISAGETISSKPARTVGLLFFEGSTRTRVSFEQACNFLGYRFVNFNSPGSSMSKGESLKDTILTLKAERLEAMVVRHRSSGSAQLAARFFGGPVVNAGDGQHEHPTQALGDAMTILERKGRLEGLKVSIVGDVEHSRVARSNIWALSKLGCEIRIVGPRTLVPSHTALLPGEVHHDLASGIAGADVVMCLRLQRERMEDGLLSSVSQFRRSYQINAKTMRYAKRDAILMHPGPINRGVELDDLVADGPSSAIHQQVENGIFVRMAALSWVFGDAAIPAKPAKKGAKS